MAGLLVGMSVMVLLMSAALPVWTHLSQREKEAELIWRGEQYARALELFQRKFANAFPPSIDVLVEQKFLRKKYRDPITGEDFQPIYMNTAQLQGPQGPATPEQPTPLTAPTQGLGGRSGTGGTQGQGAMAGPIIGVVSKSDRMSIKLYNGRNHYNEWQFVHVQAGQGIRPGQGTPQPGTFRPFPLGQGGQPGPRPAGPLAPGGGGSPPVQLPPPQ